MINIGAIFLALGIVGFVIGQFGMLNSGVELEGGHSQIFRGFYLNMISHAFLVVSGAIFLVESVRSDRVSWIRMLIGISAFLPLMYVVVGSRIRDGL